MWAAKVQASLRIRAVSPEPSLLAHTSSESRGTFRQKARSLAPLNGWACAVKICHDGMLEDTNSLDGAHMKQGDASCTNDNKNDTSSIAIGSKTWFQHTYADIVYKSRKPRVSLFWKLLISTSNCICRFIFHWSLWRNDFREMYIKRQKRTERSNSYS